jgi:transcriptional regulator with XRE-family HTH domain
MVDPAVFRQRDRLRRSRPLLRTTLGEVLRRTRLEQGRTLADVARIARVSMPYLSELERGRKEASSEILAALCEALRIELPDLLAEVRSDLVHDRDRRQPVLRLDSIRGGRLPSQVRDGLGDLAGPPGLLGGPDDMLPGPSGARPDPADGLPGPADTLPAPGDTPRDLSGARRGWGDAVCRLAA